MNRKIRNLALIGFMGVGKSTVGRIVAERLGFGYMDTDELIEARCGKTIPCIFAEDGEERFRELEYEITLELETVSDTVISTGGGLVVNPENMESLKKHALVVCLWASPRTICKRVGKKNTRPLLDEAEPINKVKSLLEARKPHYKKADVLLNVDRRSLSRVSQVVIQNFKMVADNHERGDS
ncbi:MAG: shikimate kinase [Verrucomicrobia bacterium]|nr:shikimate kinase [Verrucomicrobiota bacterium]MCF7709476.1 shikimate kinase [Verrucomicrobiota bacterium]